MQPEVRYARSSGAAIAYQVVGEGETDLVFVPDFGSNLVYAWEAPYWRDFYGDFAGRFRLILFDKRGTGISDRHGEYATLETRMEDLRAVLDAAGSNETVILGSNDGCAMAVLYAATYPERTRALALFHPSAVPESAEQTEVALRPMREGWGKQEYMDELLQLSCPTLYARGEQDRLWFANWERVSLSPAFAYALNRANAETDLRPILPAVRAPTLVLYREGSPEETQALEVAERMEGARALRISGSDYWGIFLSPEIGDELERFVAGEAFSAVPDSVLATLLFTDIVGSTERAAELGDRSWRELLAPHHATVRRELARFRGEEKDTAGDGFFATFDGPARAIRCAQAIVSGVAGLGLELRAGVHTGECELHDGKLAGLAVSVGARVAGHAGAGEVLVTSTVRDLVSGSGIEFEDRGSVSSKACLAPGACSPPARDLVGARGQGRGGPSPSHARRGSTAAARSSPGRNSAWRGPRPTTRRDGGGARSSRGNASREAGAAVRARRRRCPARRIGSRRSSSARARRSAAGGAAGCRRAQRRGRPRGGRNRFAPPAAASRRGPA
jgi:class 3 adenylate cyclase